MSRQFGLQQIRSSIGVLGGALALVTGSSVAALALSSSVGPEGIDARRLHEAPYNVTGAKIAIGQVEIGRPSQFGLDKVANADLPVNVRQVFLLDELAGPNRYVDFHAATVASVMVSQDKTLTGVAPNAVLYSAAVGPIRGRSGQPDECLSSQQVALSNGGDVRAINFSFGEPLSRDPRPEPSLDGNALLTRCIDWSALEHDVLYVVAGNQGGGGIPIPTDNFNGINVAYSRRVDGRFVKVDFANLSSEPTFGPRPSAPPESNVGTRRSINIVAPGSDIEVIGPDGSVSTVSGTSFAAPHVAAAVALVQEWGDRQFRSGRSDWSLDSREPMVTKVVLLNSADKLEDAGDGLRLGMSRTLYDESNRTWIDSDAYRDRAIPLHADLGTGHLNAYRAVLQLDAGQWVPDEAAVPVIGWSYSAVEGPVPTATSEHLHSHFQDYVFERPLQGGSYFSATLAWERLVTLNDSNRNQQYDIGESFADQGLNNLDLYLMRAEDTDIANSVWSSVSAEDSIEHLFTQIPTTGNYKLRVVYQQAVHDATSQPYALAWWAMGAH